MYPYGIGLDIGITSVGWSVVALNYTTQIIYENSINYTSQIIKQVNYDIDAYMEYLENISSVIATSSDVPRYLFDEQQSEEERTQEKERILTQYKTITESRSDIYNIAAVAENGRNIVNSGDDELTEYIDIQSLDWYQAAMSSESGIAISSSHVQNAIKSSYKWVITLSRALYNQQTGKREGAFFVDLNYSSISDLCKNNNIGKQGAEQIQGQQRQQNHADVTEVYGAVPTGNHGHDPLCQFIRRFRQNFWSYDCKYRGNSGA